MKFEVVKYEVFALENGDQAMVVTLDKAPETTQTSLVGVKTDKRVTGIAGNITLTLYDKPDQEYFKGMIGKTVEVGLTR